jgi:hypothetical protein
MGSKSMAQFLAPFACAVVVFIAFYLLGLAAGLIFLILGGLAYLVGGKDASMFFEDAIENVPGFFFLADDTYPIGGVVVAAIVWVILTCIVEMWLAEQND